jgi:hypothetical protein
LQIYKGYSIMTKIVINRCFGGFGLSDSAMLEIANRKGWTRSIKSRYCSLITTDGQELTELDIPRDDQDLVVAVELLGEKANGQYSDLMVVDIPDDVKWTIEEYDGREWVAERHRVWP